MKKYIIFLLSFYNISFYAQDGVLDTSFSDDGKFFLNTIFNYPYNSTELIYDVLEQPDEKVVFLGKSYSSNSGFFSPTYCTLFRLNTDGNLDSTFGDGGVFRYSTDTYNHNLFFTASKMMILQDGSFLIAGYGQDSTGFSADIIVIKVSNNGVLDTTFADNGIARFAIGGSNNKTVANILTYNDKLYIAGKVDQDSFILSANLDGTFNTDFNSDGIVILDINGNTNTIDQLKIINNKIYAFGSNNDVSSGNYTIFSSVLNLDGSFTSYGIGGSAEFFYGSSFPWVLQVIPKENNKILLVVNDSYYMINKYGNLDTTFGNQGQVKNPYNQSFSDCSVASDNSFYFSNFKYLGQSSNQMAFHTVKVNSDFSKAINFGSNGEVTTNVTTPNYTEQYPTRMLAMNNGKLIVCGSVTLIPNPNVPSIKNQDYVVLRYNNTLNLSTNDVNPKTPVEIYPNPVKDILTFKTSEKVKKAEIYDLNGRLLKVELGISNNKLNVSTLKIGKYIVKISTDKQSYQTKFIKQ